MCSEPGVDACDVEGVATLRQHAELLPGGEVGQADSALILQPFPLSRATGSGDGERVDGLLLQAFPREVRSRVDAGGGRGGGAVSAAAGASRDEGEADDADEGAEEGGQDDHHVGVDGDRGRGRRRRAGRGSWGGGVDEAGRSPHGVATNWLFDRYR